MIFFYFLKGAELSDVDLITNQIHYSFCCCSPGTVTQAKPTVSIRHFLAMFSVTAK